MKMKLPLLIAGLAGLAGATLLAIYYVTRNAAEPGRQKLTAKQAKMNEHQALIRLMPGGELVTHLAVKDGSWFDPGTWKTGEAPGRGAIVHVPPQVTVTYEGDSQAHLFLVRVDGTLRMQARAGVRTRMIVDTLYGAIERSHLSLEAGDPEDGSIEIEIRPFDIVGHKRAGAPGWGSEAKGFYSDGAKVLDTAAGTRPPTRAIDDGAGVLGRYGWDPQQLSIGIITHGAVQIAGKEKLSKSVIARTASRGDTSILLASEPHGWAVGDVIVVTGVHYVGRHRATGGYLGTEDEIRTVTAIRGTEIDFDKPLEFDHDTPREDLKAHAANLTRNVVIHSSEDLPLENLNADAAGRVASKLGHVMFMHNADVTVRYAAFDDLGRSNKNDNLDDMRRGGYDGLNAPRAKAGPTRTPPQNVTNPRGRYAVHLHRTGATRQARTARVEGAVVTGGPGWGFVSHDSRADFLHNVTYGVLGAGYVAETGNETGTWKGNIAINTYGADYNNRVLEPQGLYRYENEDFDQTILIEKRGSWKNHDHSHYGNGFWFQGKLIDVVDNVSVNSGLFGFFYMFRSPDQINVDPAVLVEPLSVHSPRGIHPSSPGLNVFTGNESIADRGGLAMIGLEGGRTNNERSVIQHFTAWECGQIGTHGQYYPGYNIHDSTFIASKSPGANPRIGVHFLKTIVDVVLARLSIVGFPRMYALRKSWSPGTRNQAGFEDPYTVIAEALAKGQPNPLPLAYGHILVDAGFTQEEASQFRYLGPTAFKEDVFLTSDQLKIGRFEIELDDESLKIDLDRRKIRYGTLPEDPIRVTLEEGHVLLLRGTKTDSIGSIPIDYLNNNLVWHPDAIQHRLETVGYYQMPGGHKGVILEEVLADRYTAERKVVRFVAQLDPRWNLKQAIDLGEFDSRAHPDVYVPGFLRGPARGEAPRPRASLRRRASSTAPPADPADTWGNWRGPGKTGVASTANPPTVWSEAKNIRWKVPIPGLASSSPIVWGDRVYVTTAIETDRVGPRAEELAKAGRPTKIHEFVVLALDRADGKVVWRTVVVEAIPHEPGHATATPASASPLTNGSHIYAFFGSRGLYCLDMTGKVVWQKRFGLMRTRGRFGEGSSPALHGDTLIVNWDHQGESFLVALDSPTGAQRWRRPRDEGTSWTTPLIAPADRGHQVIIAATKATRAYDLETGRQLWSCSGMTDFCVPTPVHADGLVYLMSGYKGAVLQAVRLEGAKGDLTGGDNIVWTHNRSTAYVPSALVYDDHVYFVRVNTGVLTCLDARTGEVHYEGQRLRGIRSIYASPVAAAGRVYLTSRDGTTMVVKAGPKFEMLAENKLDDGFDASAALVGDELYMRGQKHLYCIAEPK